MTVRKLFTILISLVVLTFIAVKFQQLERYKDCVNHAQQVGYTLEKAEFECKYRIKY